MSAPLRRTRKDLLAAGVIAVLAVVAVAGVVISAPVRGSELHPAEATYPAPPELLAVPTELAPAWSLTDTALPGHHQPLTVAGLVISNNGSDIAAHDPAGEVIWHYQRDREICAIGTAWQSVTVAHRNNAGCGDVVSIAADTGQYEATRSAPTSDQVVPLNSNDRVGIAGSDRVELWRSDLVRTVEYGEVTAKQEPGLQPHEDCTITSALTRTDTLATTETCPEGDFLRLQETTPADSRAPEIRHSIALADPGSRLVAVNEGGASIYQPGPEPMIRSFDSSGTQTEARQVSTAPAVPTGQGEPFAPATADLPHHMSWFDGQRLYLFTPGELQVDQVFEDAIGTGTPVAGLLLYPTEEGIAVVDPVTGAQQDVLAVDRGGYLGPVHLGVVGETVVEKRDTELVGLR